MVLIYKCHFCDVEMKEEEEVKALLFAVGNLTNSHKICEKCFKRLQVMKLKNSYG